MEKNKSNFKFLSIALIFLAVFSFLYFNSCKKNVDRKATSYKLLVRKGKEIAQSDWIKKLLTSKAYENGSQILISSSNSKNIYTGEYFENHVFFNAEFVNSKGKKISVGDIQLSVPNGDGDSKYTSQPIYGSSSIGYSAQALLLANSREKNFFQHEIWGKKLKIKLAGRNNSNSRPLYYNTLATNNEPWVDSYETEMYIPEDVYLAAPCIDDNKLTPTEDVTFTWNADANNEIGKVYLFVYAIHPNNPSVEELEAFIEMDDSGSIKLDPSIIGSLPLGSKVSFTLIRGNYQIITNEATNEEELFIGAYSMSYTKETYIAE